ncbi:MAG: glycosyltransferase family 4 protein [Candidatus Pacebacteria bacterium]|nr:glycosyltransferase family 4 protein [Candidatus Paceibacterota bacterium]
MSGAEFFIKEITERLQDKYDFVVLTSRFKKQAAREERMRGCLVRRLGFGLPLGLDKFWFMVASPFVALRSEPAIVHGVMESYAGVALIIFRWLARKIPAVLTLQCGDLDHPKKQKKIPRWLWRKIHTAPDYITAISGFLAKRAESMRGSPENVFIIPNGFDLREVPSKKEAVSGRIVCVARLSWEKGIEYLIGALPEIREKFPGARLVLVGDGNEKGKLLDLANKLGLDEAVEFRGFIPHSNAIEEISRGEVFVCPSLAEGLGNVFLEAQACRTPAVGTDVGGIPDIIQNGFNGVLVAPRDSRAIAQAVVKIFSDRVFARKIVENAVVSVRRYAWPDVVGLVDNLYRKILASKSLL